ncbi:GTPase HflX [Haloarchaeobius sp. HME9146]|uniref:GTPase HflX n=1 Tax=Haloarchaeobius sp. HME9146 TaxID=2978732 RepID=UPI0021C11733|nr:GTPase HflX [Haloarchaeobius sp. HME9146]MCT9096525.1 GTPase HflX [Haloarchaeobius sp. HME9146]
MSRQSSRAVLAARTETEEPNTDEIEALTEAAGYTIQEVFTQTRPEDPTYDLGLGKVDEVADEIRETTAGTVIVDNHLSPAQLFNLTDRLPDGTEVRDRYRLILDIFEAGASTKRAQLQVELARLRHELHRRREVQSEDVEYNWFPTHDPEGEWIREVKQRIDRVHNKLNALPDEADASRNRKREEGFDFVALAGYTNAGKSTLLHRLADDLTLEASEPAHSDLGETAGVEDRLFKTLDTTTRRATMDGRRVLLSDTVGFIRDLPHDLVEAFRSTLTEVHDADVVVLVVDASKPVAALRERIETCHAEIAGTGGSVLTVFNKADCLDDGELARRQAELADLAPNPVVASATEDDGLDELRARIVDALPTDSAEFDLPHGPETQQFVSWCHEHATVDSVTYEDQVSLSIRGRPTIVTQARSRAESLD